MWAPRRRPLALVCRRRSGRSAGLLVCCCLLLAFAATVVGARQPNRTPPVRSGTIIWAGRVFTSQHELSAWLASRGTDYAAWVKRHPEAAAGLMRPQAVEPTRSDSAQRVVVVTRAVLVTLLAIVGYLMLPVRLSFRGFRRPRLSA